MGRTRKVKQETEESLKEEETSPTEIETPSKTEKAPKTKDKEKSSKKQGEEQTKGGKKEEVVHLYEIDEICLARDKDQLYDAKVRKRNSLWGTKFSSHQMEFHQPPFF